MAYSRNVDYNFKRYPAGLGEVPAPGATPAEIDIYRAYQTELGRDPGPGDIAWWYNQVKSGSVSILQVLANIKNSPESVLHKQNQAAIAKIEADKVKASTASYTSTNATQSNSGVGQTATTGGSTQVSTVNQSTTTAPDIYNGIADLLHLPDVGLSDKTMVLGIGAVAAWFLVPMMFGHKGRR